MNRIRKFLAPLVVFSLFPLPGQSQYASPEVTTAGASGGGPFGGQHTSPFAPSTGQIVNGGLGVKILFVGRNQDGKTLTISAELQNVSDEPIFIALVGPAPAAIDTSGVTYELKKIGGLAQCNSLDNNSIAYCFNNRSNYLPGANFSLLQPRVSAIVATTFAANQASTSGFLSVTMNVALAKGERPKDDRNKDNKLENVAISFPLITLKEKD